MHKLFLSEVSNLLRFSYFLPNTFFYVPGSHPSTTCSCCHLWLLQIMTISQIFVIFHELDSFEAYCSAKRPPIGFFLCFLHHYTGVLWFGERKEHTELKQNLLYVTAKVNIYFECESLLQVLTLFTWLRQYLSNISTENYSFFSFLLLFVFFGGGGAPWLGIKP